MSIFVLMNVHNKVSSSKFHVQLECVACKSPDEKISSSSLTTGTTFNPLLSILDS